MRAVLLSERALAPTDRLFAEAVAHLARKLGRVKPLDADALPADRAAALQALSDWAGEDVSTWQQELSRYWEEHMPLYVRPRPGLNATLRGLAAQGMAIGAWSTGPAEAFDILVQHVGLARTLTATRIDPTADAPVALAAELGVSPAECVAITEEAASAQAASQAGMRVFADTGDLQQFVAA
jgi:beta-phosphoglucomutase-like phosphatase (HAD superfamily)